MSKQKKDSFIILDVKVTPKSSFSRLKKSDFPKIEIALCAVPEKGKANEELVFFCLNS